VKTLERCFEEISPIINMSKEALKHTLYKQLTGAHRNQEPS